MQSQIVGVASSAFPKWRVSSRVDVSRNNFPSELTTKVAMTLAARSSAHITRGRPGAADPRKPTLRSIDGTLEGRLFQFICDRDFI